MITLTRSLLSIAYVLVTLGLQAQLTVNAGRDTTVCSGSKIILGGTPTAQEGTGPYTYLWTPAIGLNCDTCPNPELITSNSADYILRVIDNANDTVISTIHIYVNPTPIISVSASDSIICSGQRIQLYSSVSGGGNSCGITAPCNTIFAAPTIGNGSILQPGAGYVYPSLFGNYNKSCRSQMLYTASELQLALGGAKTIEGVAFDIGLFNSNAYLLNFTIKMGCTQLDSLSDWNNPLVQVLNPSTIQPSSGWNSFSLNSPFYWDGASNIVVEVCYYNSSTFGNQNNKANCTITPHSSYIYSAGYFNQCDTNAMPVVSNLRPNLRLGYCATVALPITYQWFPTSGSDSVFSSTQAQTSTSPDSSTTYYLKVTGGNGCFAKDSVKVNVRSRSIMANLSTNNASCVSVADGSIFLSYSSSDVVINYEITDSNYHVVEDVFNAPGIWSGNVGSFYPGVHHLLFSDSSCTDMDYVFTIGVTDTINFTADISVTNNACGLANGTMQAVVHGQGTIHYTISNSSGTILFSGNTLSGDTIKYNSLQAGYYHLILTGCAYLDKIVAIGSAGNSAITASTVTTTPTCPLQNDGTILAVVSAVNDSVHYKITNYNYTIGYDSGAFYDNDTILFTSLAPGVYPLLLHDSLCTLNDVVIIYAPTTPSIASYNFSTSCYGDSTASGCVTITGGAPPYQYFWNDPALTGPCPTNVAAGGYTVTISDANNCSSAFSNIMVNQYSEIRLEIIVNYAASNYHELGIVITGGIGPYHISWGDGMFSNTSDSATHFYQTVAYDDLIVTDTKGCSFTDTIVASFALGTLENSAGVLKVFPNPTADELFIESGDYSMREIEILDVAGIQVFHQSFADVHHATVNTSNLSAGAYLLNSNSDTMTYHSWFIKIK